MLMWKAASGSEELLRLCENDNLGVRYVLIHLGLVAMGAMYKQGTSKMGAYYGAAQKMNAAIAQVIQNKTVIVIAHRLHSIVNADQICVLHQGNVAGGYKRRIQLALVFSFLKSCLAKAPVGLAFLVLSAFLSGTATPVLCLQAGIAMVICVALQVVCQHTADRLQSAAGYMVFAEKRMELGAHLRKLPMGYFTEGNIGKNQLCSLHRLNTIRHAAQIFVVAEGQIVQRGIHKALMQEEGIYRKFVSVRETSQGWNNRSA